MARRILIFRSGAIGDVLMTTPLVRAIRKKFPDAQIHYCTGNWSKEVLQGNKNIDGIITFDESIIFKRKFRELLNLAKNLRKNKYDLAFILDISYLAGMFSLLFCVKERVGFSRNNEGFMHRTKVKYDSEKHDIEYYLDMAKAVGADDNDKKMEIFISEKEKVFAAKFVVNHHLDNKRIVGISPGGAENPGQVLPLKRWPWQKYAELGDMLLEKDFAVVFFGGTNDKETIKKVMSQMKQGAVDASGISLKESAALVKHCARFVCNDSGPMHIAAAMGVPTIAIFGPTNPKKLAPLGKGHIVLQKELPCVPCYKDGKFKKCQTHQCMEEISAKEVLLATCKS